MLTYNTQLPKIKLPEYGRNIQRMVKHCMTIEDRAQRTACAHTIVRTMETLFPPVGDPMEYRRKLWDHLAIISAFELDIDWPFELIKPEWLDEKPMPVVSGSASILNRQYGRNLEAMVVRAAQMEEGPDRDALILLLANQMKKQLLSINPDGVDDMRIFKDMRSLSHGAIDLTHSDIELLEYKALPAPSKKKKKK